MSSDELKTELEHLEGQKVNLEGQLQGARVEASRHTVRRKEISMQAFLGNPEAQKELEGFTSEAVRLAHQEENLLFAIEEISLQIQDKQAEIAAALKAELKSEISAKAKNQIDLISKVPAALKEYVDLLRQIKDCDLELYRLEGGRSDLFRSGYYLKNHLGVNLAGLLNIPFGQIDRRAELIESACRLYSYLI